MQEVNRFIIRKNRFLNPIMIDKSYSCIQLKKNLKSINLKEQKFTNFAKSMGSKKYKIVKEIWEKYNNKSDITNQYMEADEMINEKNKIDRLEKIISENIGRELTKSEMINNIFKFKHKEDKEIQFYFYYNGKTLNLVLVDLFHLGIVAMKNGKYIYNSQYLNNKDNKCCLSNITK